MNPRPLLLLLAVAACGGGTFFSLDDGGDDASDVGTSADERADVPTQDSAPPESDADVRTLDGTGPDVARDAGDAGAGDGRDESTETGPVSLCCHIDCNGPATLACDAQGVVCYDAGCMFYQACAGNVGPCQ